MKFSVKVEGLKELDEALGQLPQATARNVAVRVLTKAATPIYVQAKAHAPERPADAPNKWFGGKKGTGRGHPRPLSERGKLRRIGTLEHIVQIGTRLTKNQRRLVRNEGKSFSEVYVGTRDPAGRLVEFGTYQSPAEPFMRPAWDANAGRALEIIKSELWTEIDKAAKRLARKTAKLATKG